MTTNPATPAATPETVFSVGHGLRGYLPEIAPTFHETADDAREVLLSELADLAEYLADGCDLGAGYEDIGRENADRLAELERDVAELENADVSGGWYVVSGYSAYWIELVPVSDLETEPGATLAESLEILNSESW